MSTYIAHLVSQAVDVKYSLISSIAVLFYDTVLNLEDEVEYIWRSRWSPTKALYFCIRYLALVDASIIIYYDFNQGHPPGECHRLYQLAMWFMTVGIILCQFVLIIRTYAIWGNNVFVGLYLTFVQCVAITVSCIFCNKGAKSLYFIDSPVPHVVPCIPLSPGSNVTLYAYICIAIFDFHVVLFTLIKGYSQFRSSSTPLVRKLYHDGFIYFAVLFSVSLCNVILMKNMVNSPYFYLLTEPQRVLHVILISRVILNVRITASQTLRTQQSADFEMKGTVPRLVSSLGHQVDSAA